ncbi:protein kinase family protein [Streptomyces rishiriensis]|uniref:protein kinase family protein n=1 Tax=Streptomyces rishiriensis TaxID=68264 RepID=UPI000D590A6F|nr:protein kinase family protein [Streptomyces rishiriensis]
MTKILAESGAEISHEELLDALWLAGKLPRDTAPLARAVGPSATPSDPPRTPHPDEATTPEPDVAEHITPTAAKPSEPGAARPIVAADNSRETAAAAAPSPAITVRAPENRLTGVRQLRLGKSLRPLRQRFPDRHRHELDVGRTVAAIADTGVPETVTRPVRTRWLSLALVIDDGVSMVLWQRLAADVRTLMERAGAFRDVRVYGLDTRGPVPSLHAGPYRSHGRVLTPKTLCDPSGNTLVLVVSDGVGPAWRDGGMRQTMNQWGKSGPTAIVHALPPRLWAGTGIRTRRRSVTTHRRGGPSHAWHVTDPDLPPDLVRVDSVPVPVLTPTPRAVAEWARLVASPGGTALLPLWDSDRTGSARPVADIRRNDAAEAVLRFRQAASAEAYRLAANVAAVAPVTPPVMRLVQTALGPPTDAGHLMEVFLGGLMHEVDGGESEALPQHRRFDFAVEARRILLSAVSPQELLRTTDAVTRDIEAAIGRAPVFPAWVGHPDGVAAVDDTGRSFGWLREQLLTRLGILPVKSDPVTPEPTPLPTSARQATAGSGDSEDSGVQAHTPDEIPQGGWAELQPDDPERLGRFRLRFRSARGWPHITLYLARDEDDTLVTIRAPISLYADDPQAALDLVRTEAECLRRLRGAYAPALVDVHADSVEQLPWIAAACVHSDADIPAPNLRAVFDENEGDTPEELFLRIGLDLSQALAYAHGLGLVHGSLTPKAVLVTDQDVRLIGWMTATVDGIESAHRHLLARSDTFLEVGDLRPSPTPQSDVYAVGALLLAFLSGRWTDPSAHVVSDSGIDPALHRILQRCLESDPARRPSATDLVETFTIASDRLSAAETSEASLPQLAETIARIRLLARQDLNTHGPTLTSHLMTFSNHLALVGRPEEALSHLQEAVQVYRQLASEAPQSHTAGLGAALSNLSVRLGELDRTEESLAAVSEAEMLYQSIEREDFVEFGPGLARILNNRSNRLAAAGRGQEAVATIEKAVDLMRRLADVNPRAHEEDWARVLSTLARRLSDVGQREQALAAALEAVRIYRTQEEPQFSADYAVSLNNLAVLFGDLGRRREALSILDESDDIQRRPGQDRATTGSQIRDQSERIRAWLTGPLP